MPDYVDANVTAYGVCLLPECRWLRRTEYAYYFDADVYGIRRMPTTLMQMVTAYGVCLPL